jgi:hypothetical protein
MSFPGSMRSDEQYILSITDELATSQFIRTVPLQILIELPVKSTDDIIDNAKEYKQVINRIVFFYLSTINHIVFIARHL